MGRSATRKAAAGVVAGATDAVAMAPARAEATEFASAKLGAMQVAQTAAPTMGSDVMLIRTATVAIEVAKVDPAIAAARQTVARFGAVVANAEVHTGRDEVHRAVLQIKVTAPRFDSLVAALAPLGKMESEQVNVQDVGEEYVDINARLVNLRRLEARLIDLLANRTGKLSDVLTVERELARVRGEIEQIEGRKRYLERSVALSTLELTLHEPEPIIAGTPGTNPITEAFRDAWRGFVATVAWCIAALGIVLPVAVVALALGVGLRWTLRRLRPIFAP